MCILCSKGNAHCSYIFHVIFFTENLITNTNQISDISIQIPHFIQFFYSHVRFTAYNTAAEQGRIKLCLLYFLLKKNCFVLWSPNFFILYYRDTKFEKTILSFMVDGSFTCSLNLNQQMFPSWHHLIDDDLLI